MEAKVRRRKLFKNYVIDKEFQYAYIRRSLFILFFVVVAVAAVFIFWNRYKFNQGFLLQPPSGTQVTAWAKENNIALDSADYAYQFIIQAKTFTFFDLIWRPILAVFIATFFILLISGLYFSFKIAGPIYRLKRILEKIESGEEVEPLKFRKNDPFHELSELFNRAVLKKEQPPQDTI